MNLEVLHQNEYSRGELLLRTFFGLFYIGIPHGIVLFFLEIWGGILQFISFWVILFTGRYPENFFNYQVQVLRWNLRVGAAMSNLVDGYPEFGLDAVSGKVMLEVEYPGEVNRGLTVLKALFGWLYVLIPHAIALIFRGIAAQVLQFLAFWVVLFTGKYPGNWFDFQVGTLRWSMRVELYLMYLTDRYPPFSGKRDEELAGH